VEYIATRHGDYYSLRSKYRIVDKIDTTVKNFDQRPTDVSANRYYRTILDFLKNDGYTNSNFPIITAR